MFNNTGNVIGGADNGIALLERIIDLIIKLFSSLFGGSNSTTTETTTVAETTTIAETTTVA